MASMLATQEQQHERLLHGMLKLTGRLIRDEGIEFRGREIVLPEGTTVEENIEFLQRFLQDQEEATRFTRTFTFKVWDVAYCTTSVLRKVFGSMRHTGTFLEPPQLVDIPNGPGSTVQVPFGKFIIPALPDVQFSVQGHLDDRYGTVGLVTAVGPKKHKAYVESIYDLIEAQLKEESLYRGKAFTDDDKPEFIDVDAIDPSRIVYSEDVQKQIAANVYARLDHPDVLADMGISFKSAILLEGEFGVGKTECLNLIAKRAVERGKTFIKVKSNGDLMQAMQTARMYAPSIVAFEDVDGVASAEQDSERITQVLEAFDGQQAKLNEVMVLITSNYVEKLHKGIVRPGRIDAIINIGPPDAEGIRKLVEVRTPVGLLSTSIEWHRVAEAMEGYFPSFVVEATSRAMRYGVVRVDGPLADGDLTTDDLVGAAHELRRQFDLHRDAQTGTQRPDLETAFINLVHQAVGSEDDTEEGLATLAHYVAREGAATRAEVEERADQLAERVVREATEVRSHETAEAEYTREVIEERT